MGEIASIRVDGNAELQAAALGAIQAAQQDDPLAPVTLIVDSPSQGWALRRQLIRAWPIGTGVANLRALTLTEFLGELASPTNLRLPGTSDDVLRSAVVEATLRSQTGPLAASKDHPDTAVRLSTLTDQLAWCRLDSATIDGLPPEEVSATARAAIGFARDARQVIAEALDEPSWPDACSRIVTWLGATPSASVPTGVVVCCARRLPTAAQAVLTALAGHVSVTRVVVQPGAAPISATVADFPDPATECSMAVRLASDAIRSKVAPDRVAIVYSTDLPYSMLLEDALTAAGLEWHGPTGQTLQATAVARYVSALLAMATARVDKSSGITRPLLMKWLGLGTIYDGDSAVPSGAIRALIRQEGPVRRRHQLADASWRHGRERGARR